MLEPYYDFILKVPNENVGRAMTDICAMSGSVNQPENSQEFSVLTGYAPVSTMWNYINTVNEYTHGKGTLTLKFKGYAPCHNSEEVIAEKGYDSELDLRNPTGSVFCAHGSGFNVPWNEVENYMHVKTELNLNNSQPQEEISIKSPQNIQKSKSYDSYATDKELEAIFEKTFGKVKRKKYQETKIRNYNKSGTKKYKGKVNNNLPECILVDGYNIIFAWEELNKVAKVNIDGARDKLLDIMSNYQGYKGNTVIVVFDAYNVNRHKETIYKHNNIYVVFTKEAETADMYIAKTTHQMANKYKVTVATSDALEQLIIMGHGALRMSAMNFKEEVENVEKAISAHINTPRDSLENYLIK